jgi:uncharacterized membrane protein
MSGPVGTLQVFLSDHLGIRVKPLYLKEKLVHHHSYPSLLSISETLKYFDPGMEAYKVNTGSILDLSPPFLAHCPREEGGLVIVESVQQDKTITWYSALAAKRTDTIEKFSTNWSGIVLMPGTKRSHKRRSLHGMAGQWKLPRHLLLPFFAAFLLISFFLIQAPPVPVTTFFVFALAAFGIYASWLLILQTVSMEEGGQGVCKDSKRISCDSILQSKAAKLFGVFRWADIGFVYFSWVLLNILFSNDKQALLAFLSVVSTLAVGYPVFSIFYQSFIARKWCVLCMVVQVLLIAHFLLLLPFLSIPSLPVIFILQTSLFLLASIFILGFLYPFIRHSVHFRLNRKLVEAVKEDPIVLRQLISSQASVDTTALPMDLLLGNAEAEHKLIFVSNPYCAHCAKTFVRIERLYRKFPGRLSVNIVFKIPASEKHAAAARAMIDLYFQAGSDSAIDGWLELYQNPKKNLAAPAEETAAGISYNTILESHQVWCDSNGIKSTPTLVYNKNILPNFLKVDDLALIIN